MNPTVTTSAAPDPDPNIIADLSLDLRPYLKKPEHPATMGPNPAGKDPEAGNPTVPIGIIPTPTGGISNTVSAGIIFGLLAKGRKVFRRMGSLCMVEDGGIKNVSADGFCSLIEKYGRVASREIKENKPVWRSTTLPKCSAGIIIASKEISILPPLRQISNCAIISRDCQVLGAGYHDHAGGTYISAASTPATMTVDEATSALEELLIDFDFTTPADKSRGIASLLSPALKMGEWLSPSAKFPLDFAEANESQSGKSLRLQIVCALYRETFKAVTAPKGGVGSLDEILGTVLIAGRPFISIDNFRGKVDSTIMEAALTSNEVQARGFRMAGTVDCRTFLWQFSTNGAEITRDLANRSIITRIRKRPANTSWRKYEEGEVMEHLQANQPRYLGAVFTILKDWTRLGCPKTDECRHDFREWCQALDWIVQNIFGMAPLLDGHREEQARTSNPALTWVRVVALAVIEAGQQGKDLTTSDLVTTADEAGIEFPGQPNRDEPAHRAGRILGKLFKEAGSNVLVVDGLSISRQERQQWAGGGEMTKFYMIARN